MEGSQHITEQVGQKMDSTLSAGIGLLLLQGGQGQQGHALLPAAETFPANTHHGLSGKENAWQKIQCGQVGPGQPHRAGSGRRAMTESLPL